MKKVWKWVTRIDNLNRILVCISFGLFLFYPSYILYFTQPFNQSLTVILPCLLILGVVIGTGLFAFYRPLRTPFFYFAEMFIILFSNFYDVHPDYISSSFPSKIIFWIEIIYCFFALLINIGVFTYYLHYGRAKGARKEDTNEDTPFDFLNADNSNRMIEKDLEKITENKNGKNMMKAAKKIHLSSSLRLISFFIAELAFIICLFIVLTKEKNAYQQTLVSIFFCGVVLSPILIVAAKFYPRDFKYAYFYNTALFLLLAIVGSRSAKLNPVLLILALIFLVFSFLITLIVEGRTWMGASTD